MDPREATGKATAEAVLDAVRRETLAQVPVWLPARVTAWRAPGVVNGFQMPARVDVEVLLEHIRYLRVADDAEPGEYVRERDTGLECHGTYNGATEIPVCYPGPRNMRTRGPLEVGEQGMLLCSTRAIETWAAGYAAEADGPVDPMIGLGFRPSAAIFVPGLEVGLTEGSAFPSVLRLGDPDGLGGLSYDGTGSWALDGATFDVAQSATIDLEAPSISLNAAATVISNGGAALAPAKNAQVIAAFNAYNTALQGGTQFSVAQKAELAAATTAAVAVLIGATTVRVQ